MTATLQIDVDHREVTDYLNRLVKQLKGGLKPVFADIGEYLQLSHRQRFERHQAPDGSTWKELSPDYKAIKPKNKNKILLLEGYLRDLLRYQASDTELLFGTDRIYGALHQFGAKRGDFGITTVNVKAHQRRGHAVKAHTRQQVLPWGDIPARPWLGLSTDDETEIINLLREWLVP